MAKNPTPWSNNDVKPPAAWSGAAKGVVAWMNNITKIPSQFVQSTKSVDNWAINFQLPQTYFYNDANMPYNSPYIEYNYLLQENQINQKLVTRWGQVV